MSDKPIHVVVVDDDRDDFFMIKEFLSDVTGTQYQTEWIQTFSAGIESIKKQNADVYIIDYRLGSGHTGLDILDSLQGLNLKKPIIVLTGQTDRMIDIAAMQKGASDFLTKDRINSDLLERSIRYSVKRAQDQEKINEAVIFKADKIAADIANKAKSHFLANMSHEIRTPLGAILGFAELAHDPAVSEKERIEFISVIKKSGEGLLEIINDVLDLSKIEAGHLQVESNDFNWRSVLNEVMDLLKPSCVAKGISLIQEIASGIPDILKSDSHRFRQVLTNLIGNAIKFTARGQVTIKCKTEPRGQNSEATLVISVQDTGIGIHVNDQKKLFEPFSQGNSSLSSKYGGTGLGLDLSRKLARALKGNVTLVRSLIDVGSTFDFTLPADFSLIDSEKQNSRPTELEKISSKLSSGQRILLVDDSVANQIIVKSFLLKAGYEVYLANNGREGVSKALNEDYDIVLMDIQMPEMDGYEATQRLRLEGYAKPIIALTAHALGEERKKAFHIGFSDYITKPIRRDILLTTLKKYKDGTDTALPRCLNTGDSLAHRTP